MPYYIHYIVDFFTIRIILIVLQLNIKETNTSSFKCINILLFVISCLTLYNTYADPFECDYIIYYTYLIIRRMFYNFPLLLFLIFTINIKLEKMCVYIILIN